MGRAYDGGWAGCCGLVSSSLSADGPRGVADTRPASAPDECDRRARGRRSATASVSPPARARPEGPRGPAAPRTRTAPTACQPPIRNVPRHSSLIAFARAQEKSS